MTERRAVAALLGLAAVGLAVMLAAILAAPLLP